MAIEITKQEGTAMWTNEGEDMYLTADRSAVVDANDPRAAFLLVARGGQIPIDEAEKYGLTGDQSSTMTDEPTDEPTDAKAKPAAPENKLKAAPTNKGRG
jgi:hypothetical protein